MSRDPDFEKARAVVRAEESFVEEVVVRIVGKHSARIIVVVVLATFALGGFMANLRLSMSGMELSQEKVAKATKDRLDDWTPWRKDVDDRFIKLRETRFTNLDYDTAVWMVTTHTPPLWMPYFREVKKEQGTQP